jgi:hypothetical protein
LSKRYGRYPLSGVFPLALCITIIATELVDGISALGASPATYGITAAGSSSDAGAAADAATDIGPAAVLMLSSLNLQSQMVSALFCGGTLGSKLDVRA